MAGGPYAYHLTEWQGTVRLQLGLARLQASQWAEAFEDLLPLLHGSPSDEDRYAVCRGLGQASLELAQPRQAVTFFGLAQMTVGPRDPRWIRMGINQATACNQAGLYEKAEVVAQRAADAARECGEAVLEAWAAIGWTSARLLQGRVPGCADKLDRAEHLGLLVGEPTLRQAVAQNRTVVARLSGDSEAWARALAAWAPPAEAPRLLSYYEEQLWWAIAQQHYEAAERIISKAEVLEVHGHTRARFWLATAAFFAQVDRLSESDVALWTAAGLFLHMGNDREAQAAHDVLRARHSTRKT